MKVSVKTWSTPVAAEESRLIPCALCGGTGFSPRFSCEGFAYVRCDHCGLVQMNPQPLAAEISRRYRDGHGEDYLSYELANEKPFLDLQLLALHDAGFEELEGNLQKTLSRPPRILDIGCATGSLLAHLRDRGWETAGVEICAAEADYGRRVRGLDIKDRPLEACGLSGGHFDAALASHLIEHVNDPAALVREVHRILTPGGIFLVTTPNIAGFQARLFGGRWRSAIFDHLYLFSAETLSALVRQNGFTVETVRTWGGLAEGTAPAPIKRLFDKGAKKFGFGDVMLIRSRSVT